MVNRIEVLVDDRESKASSLTETNARLSQNNSSTDATQSVRLQDQVPDPYSVPTLEEYLEAKAPELAENQTSRTDSNKGRS